MFELIFCESVLLAEINDKRMRQKDVAFTYGLSCLSSENSSINWSLIHKKIIERWNERGLKRVKKLAYQFIDNCQN